MTIDDSSYSVSFSTSVLGSLSHIFTKRCAEGEGWTYSELRPTLLSAAITLQQINSQLCNC